MTTNRDPSVFAFSGPDTLPALRSMSTKHVRRIIVIDASMPSDEARTLERRLNRWYFACGCEQGSVVVMLTLFTCAAAGIVHGFDGPFTWWRIVAYLLTAALAGKALGLAYAKARLHHLYRQLESRSSWLINQVEQQ